MSWQRTRIWLTAALCGPLFLGCHSAASPLSTEPLLQSKKPVDGKIDEKAAPEALASVDPLAPPVPSEAVASMPPSFNQVPSASVAASSSVSLRPHDAVTLAAPQVNAAAQTAAAPLPTRRPVTATPAVRSSQSASPAASLAVRKRVPGTFGHDAEYTWLQGVLDKHYHGHFYLRYCDPTVEDPWGGKVCFDEDPRLAQFKDGDVIYVEGAIVPEPDTSRHSGWKHYPRYKINAVKLVESKSEPAKY